MSTTSRTAALHDSLPDLPGLESVEVADSASFVPVVMHVLMMLAFTALCIWCYLDLGEFIPRAGVALVGAVVALSGWMVLRIFAADFYWRTDPRGITARGILRRRFVAWGEISGARSVRTRLGETVYKLHTSNLALSIRTRTDYRLAASIWQHLRRQGKVYDLEMPDAALSCWDDIPDEIPREIEWKGRSRVGEAVGFAVFVLVFVGLLAWMIIDFGPKWPALVVFLVLGLGIATVAWLSFRELTTSASYFHLRDDRFEARTICGASEVYWSDVTGAAWQRMHLVIRCSRPRSEVRVPCSPDDEQSAKLILALVRRLRTAGAPQAVPIPEALRGNLPTTPEQGAPAELRRSTLDILITPAPAAMIGILLVAQHRDPSLRLGPEVILAVGLALLALYALCVVALSASSVRADSAGITRRSLLRSRFIPWEAVARYEVTRPMQRGHAWQFRLLDPGGRVLAALRFDHGAGDHLRAFLAFIEARLGSAPELPVSRPRQR